MAGATGNADFIGVSGSFYVPAKAVCDGVPLISYNTWTFMDVVSSSDGFQKRYGLVYVNREELDQKDLKRIKKDSFHYYQKLIAENGEFL